MKPQLNPVRIGEHVYLRRLDTGSYARMARDPKNFEWTTAVKRASKWTTSTAARSEAATLGHETTPIFGHN